MATVGDLSGGGGAERLFSLLHEYLQRVEPGACVLVTSAIAKRRLREAERLKTDAGVIALPLGATPGATRPGIIWTTLCLLAATIGRGFDVVHIVLPTPTYVPYAAVMTRLPRSWRPAIAVMVLDCTLASNLTTGTAADLYERQVVDAHRMYFDWTRLDGIYTWYRAFADAARALRLVGDRTLVSAARYCFTDTTRFRVEPGKQRTVIYAGRLSVQKRPLLFVDAIASLLRRAPALALGWTFEMYGGGPLEAEVRARIEAHGLTTTLALKRSPDLAPVFARSQLFVSTQALENFTSQSMLEAMAAGNAVVAEDVGQTSAFVRDGENGLLVTGATADQFADAIADYMAHPERHHAMAAASRRLATEVHTIEHFTEDILSFWGELART